MARPWLPVRHAESTCCDVSARPTFQTTLAAPDGQISVSRPLMTPTPPTFEPQGCGVTLVAETLVATVL